MHVTLAAGLMLAAFILFLIAIPRFVTPKIEIIAAGLACAAASFLFG